VRPILKDVWCRPGQQAAAPARPAIAPNISFEETINPARWHQFRSVANADQQTIAAGCGPNADLRPSSWRGCWPKHLVLQSDWRWGRWDLNPRPTDYESLQGVSRRLPSVGHRAPDLRKRWLRFVNLCRPPATFRVLVRTKCGPNLHLDRGGFADFGCGRERGRRRGGAGRDPGARRSDTVALSQGAAVMVVSRLLGSQGLRQGTPRGSKCLVFRVATVISATWAMAAMRASSSGACSGTR
jgi:hypothetical protein